MDDVLIVGIELLVGLAQLHQLLERGGAGRIWRCLGCALHRTGKIIEFDQVAVDVGGRRNDAADILARGMLQRAFPIAQKWFGSGHDKVSAFDPERHDGEAVRIIDRHQVGQIGEVDLQRVDMEIFHADAFCQPFRQGVQRQDAVGCFLRFPVLVRNGDQRMCVLPVEAAFGDERFSFGFSNHAVGNHHVQHFGQFQFVLRNVLRSHIHALIEVLRTIPLSGGGFNQLGR